MNPFIDEDNLVIDDIQLESKGKKCSNSEPVKPLINIPLDDLVGRSYLGQTLCLYMCAHGETDPNRTQFAVISHIKPKLHAKWHANLALLELRYWQFCRHHWVHLDN